MTKRTRHKLIRKYDELQEKLIKKPLIKLDKPIFRGYIRYHVVREDILKSPEGKYMSIILPYVSNQEFSRRKDFRYKYNKTIKFYVHKLNLISLRQYEEELKPKLPERYHHLFYRINMYQVDFIKAWMFETKISRSYITHISEPLGDTEGEFKKVSDKLNQDHIWEKTYGTDSRHIKWDRPNEKRKRDLGYFKDQEIREELL